MTLYLKFNGGFDEAITQLFLNNSMPISSTNIKDKLACEITKKPHTHKMHNLGQIEKKHGIILQKLNWKLTQHEFDIFLSDIFHLFLNC
jgi:hypothetical protein